MGGTSIYKPTKGNRGQAREDLPLVVPPTDYGETQYSSGRSLLFKRVLGTTLSLALVGLGLSVVCSGVSHRRQTSATEGSGNGAMIARHPHTEEVSRNRTTSAGPAEGNIGANTGLAVLQQQLQQQSPPPEQQGEPAPYQPRLGAGPGDKLGACYDPVHSWSYPTNMDAVFRQDMPLIARHFRVVRTFYARYYGTDVMPYIANAGLRACLGVSIADGLAEQQKGAAVRAYHATPDNIESILVGNEDLIPVGPFTVDHIIGHMNDLRARGVKAPIGTSQRINEWLIQSPEIDRLAAACDVIGVNIYPYFSTPRNDGEANEMMYTPVENMKHQYEAVLRRFPGQESKVRITETGWPSAGVRNFAGHDASLEQAARNYHQWVGWTCSQPYPSYFYTYFDRRWPTDPNYEQFFGVVDANGNPKFDLTNGVCG